MDRRPLQLAAAFVLLASLLGVSTALVAEVREEIIRAQERQDEAQLGGPDARSGIPIHEFTLLTPAEAVLPGFQRVSKVLQVTENGTLFLEKGDRIQVSPVPLTGKTSVTLIRGGTYEGLLISCPDGCVLGGDAGRMVVPPNGTLLLPTGARLPLDDGPIAPSTSLDLPAGTRMFLPPITMGRDTELPLGVGAVITLPANSDLTKLGERLEGAAYLLPAQTRIRGATTDQEGAPDLQDLLQNRDMRREPPPVKPPREPPPRPIIEVTESPTSIQKGTPFQVAGTVDLPDGTPSAGHPITLYANATKREPGFEILIGQLRTDANGRFEGFARIEESRPTQPYHILAKAHELPERNLKPGWSDPIVQVEGSPTLILSVPATEGVRVPIAFQARLQDEFAAPVPGQEVQFRVQGTNDRISATTDGNGDALAIFHGFPFPGTWTIVASFSGTRTLEEASAQDQIEIVEARILTQPTVVVSRGSQGRLAGEVELEDRAADGLVVQASYGGNRAQATTDAQGKFDLLFDVPETMALGNHTLELATTGVTAKRSIVLTVTGETMLRATGPPIAPLGGTYSLNVRVTDELGAPQRSLVVIARTPAGRESTAVTGDDGATVVAVSLATLGRWNLSLTTAPTIFLAPGVALVPFAVGTLDVDGDFRLTPGAENNVTLTLSALDQPLVNQPIELRAPGITARTRTDAEGVARVMLDLPAGIEPGPTDLDLVLDEFHMLQVLPGVILDRPNLEIEVLRAGTRGEDLLVRVTATGTNGYLGGVPLVLETHGAFESVARAETGPDGTADVRIDRPRDADGPVVVTARALETATTGAATQSATTTVSPAPFPWLLLAPIPPLAAGAYAIYRYRKRPGRGVAAPAPGPTIELSIAPQRDELPAVWHVGEGTTLHLRLVDARGRVVPGAPLVVDGPSGRERVQLDEKGEARLAVPAGASGSLSFRARFSGGNGHKPTEASLEVRLVDYREEIDREYRALRSLATATGLVSPDVTPRELARAYGSSDTALRLVRLFERCDYSTHPVERPHYEHFMRSKQALLGDGGDGGA